MKFLAILFFFLLLFSCQNKEKTKEEKLTISNIKDHFYPYDTVPKIYVYRDVVGGLEEKFHRVYALQDQEGKHVIVEIYSSDFRIIEALNYDYSTLLYKDHMVVNRNKEKTKADLIKNKAFPSDDKSIAEFSSRFPGHLDSSLIIKEIKRKWNKNQVNTVNVSELLKNRLLIVKLIFTFYNYFFLLIISIVNR